MLRKFSKNLREVFLMSFHLSFHESMVRKIEVANCCYIGQSRNSFANRRRTHQHDVMINNSRGQTALPLHVRQYYYFSNRAKLVQMIDNGEQDKRHL